MEAAATNRRRLVYATGIAVIVLLVLTASYAAREFYQQLVKEKPIPSVTLQGVQIWQTPLIQTLTTYSYVLGAAIFLAGAVLFLVRLVLTLRVLEFLYTDSDRSEDRGFSGFMLNALSLVLQLFLTYLMINASRKADGRLALFLLLCLFVVNGLWLFWIYLLADRTEKAPLRGVWRAGFASLVFAAVLMPAQWYWEPVFGRSSDDIVLRSVNAAIAGGFMVLLCAVDGYVQSQTYARKEKPSAARYTVAAIAAAVLLALALYLIGTALTSPSFWR